MQHENAPLNLAPHTRIRWIKVAMLALIGEKIVQHIVVTLAFAFDWAAIRATVVVPPSVLIVLGAAVAVAYALSFWGIITQRRWATDLVIALALFDIAGEFVAQGTFRIVMTLSFLVAIVLLVLALLYRRQLAGGPKG